MKLVFGQDAAVAEWVAKRIPHMNGGAFREFTAIGVADGDLPIAGVVFNEYYPDYGTMQLSMAADTPRWAQRGIIRGLLSFPFEQVGVYKLWTATPQKNSRALKFNAGVGIRQEGVLRHHFGHKNHAVICSMIEPEYRALYKENSDGEEIALAATGT